MEERLRILEMVREGKLSLEEADRLLDALEAERARSPERARTIRLHISDGRGQLVNLTLPMRLTDMLRRLLPKGLRVNANGEEIDIAHLLDELRGSGATGRIVDFNDGKGARIQITVE